MRVGVAKETVTNLYEYFRETEGKVLKLEPLLMGTVHAPVKIDECFFS